MNKFILISCVILSSICISCNKKKAFDGISELQEDFESINETEDLFQNGKWDYYQQTETGSYIELNQTNVHSGTNALKIFATKGTISKSDLANNNMAFWENDVVEMSAWYYIEDTTQLDYLFIMDIEEKVAIGASPGIRIAIDDKGYLMVDRSKFGLSTLHQPDEQKIKFPKNQWVEVKCEIKLHQKSKGYIKLWQNGVLLIDESGLKTLPKDKLYFIQGTKGMYQSFQVGVTATSSDVNVIMYLDDVSIKKID